MDDLRQDGAELQRLSALVDSWIETELSPSPVFLSVERPEPARWRIRVRGERREVITVWWWLRDYTLWSEAYFLPAPAENRERLFEAVLRWNAQLYGVAFAIGEEDAIYLVGRCPWTALREAELDRLFGCMYETIERYFDYALVAAGYR
jgi:hypothetical protein